MFIYLFIYSLMFVVVVVFLVVTGCSVLCKSSADAYLRRI